ncbi:hypothetical protein HRbin36_02611 [bacterium HR36]|nr:hypothetical protein HRbin36_02611 [bacterium HR36]
MTPYFTAQPTRICTEPLADQPAVSLRFYDLSDGQRVLAEVLFPSPRFDIRQAKVFLAQQLEQVMFWPGALLGRWREEDAAIVLEWSASPATLSVSYGQGVQEELLATPEGDGRTAWRSVRLRFDKTYGWNIESAQGWLQDWGNVQAPLQASWLWCWRGGVPPLGDWPNWVLGLTWTDSGLSGLWRIPRAAQLAHSSRSHPPQKRQEFEQVLDLASGERGRLPVTWQCRLPARGRVYPQQAREVVQRLRQWRPHLLHQATHWAIVGWWEKPQLELLRLLAREELTDLATNEFQWLTIEQCRNVQVEGVVVVVDSLGHWPHCAQLRDWLLLGAAAERRLVLMEPDYASLFRQLNSRKHNPIWLTELLQRIGRLTVLSAPSLTVPALASANC